MKNSKSSDEFGLGHIESSDLVGHTGGTHTHLLSLERKLCQDRGFTSVLFTAALHSNQHQEHF